MGIILQKILHQLWHPGAVDAGSTYVSLVDGISVIANINQRTSSTLIAPHIDYSAFDGYISRGVGYMIGGEKLDQALILFTTMELLLHV